MGSANRSRQFILHLMLLPAVLVVFVYHYIPMVGISIAFENFNAVKGFFRSQWVGLDNFKYIIALPGTTQALYNTVIIAALKIVTGLAVPLVLALLLNEVRVDFIKRSVQTLVYLPHFLSWVILGGVLIDILSPGSGILNMGIKALGLKPIFFLGDNRWFRFTVVVTNVWKEAGWGTILYLAAITGVDPSLYEAALADGANRFKQMWHITLPGILPTIVLLATLSLGNVLNAGFDQIFNLYSPVVYHTGDILDTLVYRMGLINAQYGPSTAVGLFKSVVSLFFISISYSLAYKFADYRIF